MFMTSMFQIYRMSGVREKTETRVALKALIWTPDDIDCLFSLTAFLNFDSSRCQSLPSSGARLADIKTKTLTKRKRTQTYLLLIESIMLEVKTGNTYYNNSSLPNNLVTLIIREAPPQKQ